MTHFLLIIMLHPFFWSVEAAFFLFSVVAFFRNAPYLAWFYMFVCFFVLFYEEYKNHFN